MLGSVPDERAGLVCWSRVEGWGKVTPPAPSERVRRVPDHALGAQREMAAHSVGPPLGIDHRSVVGSRRARGVGHPLVLRRVCVVHTSHDGGVALQLAGNGRCGREVHPRLQAGHDEGLAHIRAGRCDATPDQHVVGVHVARSAPSGACSIAVIPRATGSTADVDESIGTHTPFVQTVHRSARSSCQRHSREAPLKPPTVSSLPFRPSRAHSNADHHPDSHQLRTVPNRRDDTVATTPLRGFSPAGSPTTPGRPVRQRRHAGQCRSPRRSRTEHRHVPEPGCLMDGPRSSSAAATDLPGAVTLLVRVP